MTAKVKKDGAEVTIEGSGNGPIDAYVDALKQDSGKDIKVFSYSEHSVGGGSDATAIAFVETEVDGKHLYGIGQDPNIVSASLIAVTCAVNRAIRMAVSMKPHANLLPSAGEGRTRDVGG